MGKMVRAVLFALMAVFSTAVFAEEGDPCAMPANLTEIDGVYQIGTCGDLYKFAEMVNNGQPDIKGRLTADIGVNVGVLTSDGTLSGTNFTQWTPIGTYGIPYAGIFDGDGHTISGLYFNDENVNYVGLFGFIGDKAKIQNVGVVDSYIRGARTVGGVVGLNEGGTISNVYNTGAVSGNDRVGGVVGWNMYGTISNVYNTGAVSGTNTVGGVVGHNVGGTVSNVYNTGAVSGNMEVGGVVGYIDAGVVSNAYNTGSVSVTGNYVGGVAGGVENKGSVSNVYNTGAVSGWGEVGGVAGWNGGGSISNVYNTGTVIGENGVGGVVGYNEGTVENAYYNTDFYAGNALGENKSGSIENVDGKPTAELIAIDLGPEWVAGNLAYDKTTGKLAFGFPYLKNFGNSQYKITALEFKVVDNVIQIANADDLENFARLVSEFGVTDVDAELTADICLNACGEGERVLKADGTLNGDGSNFMQWTPIGTAEKPYAGTFDGMDAEGKAHVISGLYFNDENVDYVGLFGFIGSGSKVQNVGVVDSYILGKDAVGGVVGLNAGGTVSNVYNTGIVEGGNYVGGVAGYIDAGVVSNAYNTGSVSVTGNYVGGVAGGVENKGSVSNVYNMGSVGGARFAIGGVVGFDKSVTISNAYFNTDFFTGNALGFGDDVENVGGKTSAELVAGTSLKLDTAFWVVGGVGVDTPKDTLYYPYLKVFGPHMYVLGDVMKYTIAVSVNDEAMGTVTGAGEYKYSVKVELSAIANEGYRFTDWQDGVKNAVRTITVTKDETYTANFEAIPSSSSEVESSSSVAESSSSVDESSSSEAVSSSSEAKSSSSEVESSSSEAASSSSEAKSSSSEAKSSSSSAKSSSSSAKSSSSEAKSSSSEAKSSSSSAKSSSSEAKSSSSDAKSSSSEAKSSSSSAKSSSSSAKSSSSEAKSSSSEAKSSSSSAKSSSSSAKSSSSEAKSSSSDAKSSSSQKESIIAQAQLPQFSVTASGKMVSIAGARPNTIVNVFDMQGNMVKTVVATSANFTFALPSAGVYIVKNGYTAKRVNVR